ncbi:hypothetical protein [Micropruina sp.]|uniref:hypothetical protein n=1 Tax=Micropruina sp. TaxID=2737536 RepID=UPI0039E25956
MSDQYNLDNSASLATDAWAIANSLPAGIGDAFRVVAVHGSADDPAQDLQSALGNVRDLVGRSYLPRVAAHEILPLSLSLSGFLRRFEGWQREALTALAAAATARRLDESRSALLVALDAIERGGSDLRARASAA